MSFAVNLLVAARQQAVQAIVTAQQQVDDIDELLAKVTDESGTPAPATPPDVVAQHFNHAHVPDDQGGVENVYTPPADVPAGETLVGETSTPPAEPEQGPGVEFPEQIDGGPFAPRQDAPPEKKGGRRTNEEIAADHGVSLDDVKTWLGANGGRVTAAKIKEFAELHPAAVAQEAANEISEHQQAAATEQPPWEQPEPATPAPASDEGGEFTSTETFDFAPPF